VNDGWQHDHTQCTRSTAEHGTHHGQQHHWKKREPTCRACKDAHAEYMRHLRGR